MAFQKGLLGDCKWPSVRTWRNWKRPFQVSYDGAKMQNIRGLFNQKTNFGLSKRSFRRTSQKFEET